MGRRPKATVSRINNLRHPRKILRAPVEDIQTDLEDLDFNGNPPHNHAIDSEDEIDNEEIEDESMDKPVTDADLSMPMRRVYQDQLQGLTRNIMGTGSFHPKSSPNSKMSSIKSMGMTKLLP